MVRFHWMSEYWLPVNMKDVRFAKKLLKNPIFEKSDLNYAREDGENYIIKDVEVRGYSVKDVKDDKLGYVDKGAVFFWIDKGLIQLGKSYYPHLRFSVPKSNIVKHETDELDVVQEITITEWAYENCYMFPINKILEDWGRHMRALISYYDTKAWSEAPMYTGSPYREIIEELNKQEIREAIKHIKKKEKSAKEIWGNNKQVVHQGNVKTNIREKTETTLSDIDKNNGNNDTIKKAEKSHKSIYKEVEPFRKEAEYIFYTDGSGNWASGKKHKDKGSFNVYLLQTQERWKRKEDKLTGNQAELLGVMSAISIAEKRKYKNVKILTDSMNVVNWITKKKDSEDYFWNAKHPNIVSLVERLREMVNIIPNLQVKYIKREVNYAHSF